MTYEASVIFAGTREGIWLGLNESEAYVRVTNKMLSGIGDLAPYWQRVNELREEQETATS